MAEIFPHPSHRGRRPRTPRDQERGGKVQINEHEEGGAVLHTLVCGDLGVKPTATKRSLDGFSRAINCFFSAQ
ncbi:hypothetical protein J2129_000992 [Methanofollis sp. W23]|nr:hypothetical protein [Methanofollis sp. W23]